MIQTLIVEDDYRIAEIHEKFLMEMDGIKVIGKALTGKEAIAIATEHEIDLILLDLYLPDMLGIDVIRELRNLRDSIDFIIISAASEMEIVEKTIRRGVFDYIIKPVIKERLLESISSYQKWHYRLKEGNVLEQNILDNYFGISTTNEVKSTPKGIDPLTLVKVKEIIQGEREGITAEKMGEKIGASRTTARRYLEYLISQNEIVADLEYGTIGRPERIYLPIKILK